jgi:hypothetical protein
MRIQKAWAGFLQFRHGSRDVVVYLLDVLCILQFVSKLSPGNLELFRPDNVDGTSTRAYSVRRSVELGAQHVNGSFPPEGSPAHLRQFP